MGGHQDRLRVNNQNELKSTLKRSMLCVFNTFLLSLCLFWTYFSNRTFYLIFAHKLLKSYSCWQSDNCWRFEGENILLQSQGIRLCMNVGCE